jgi:hypothetical protein
MDQLRDNTGKKQKILARLKKNNARSAPCKQHFRL